jgi:hypothetical protein
MIETLLIIITVGAMCIISFAVGAKVGQRVSKGQPVEIPLPNPIRAIQEHKSSREAKQEQTRLDTIMRNIERYNGTSSGQEEVR